MRKQTGHQGASDLQREVARQRMTMTGRCTECPAVLGVICGGEGDCIGDGGARKGREAAGDENERQHEEERCGACAGDQITRKTDLIDRQRASHSCTLPPAEGACLRFTGISITPSRKAEKNSCRAMTMSVRPSTTIRGMVGSFNPPKPTPAQEMTA